MKLENLLVVGAKEYGVCLSEEQINLFFLYKNILHEWNQKINLTTIISDEDVIMKHFIDSISIVPFINKSSDVKLIDVGSGAGFPGIPIKIVYDRLEITLLDSILKKVKFLESVIENLKLKRIDAVRGRAEESAILNSFRGSFDICTARAVAHLPVLLKYCLPLIRTGGHFIAMKGSNLGSEIDDSKKILNRFKCRIREIRTFKLPFSDIKRTIVCVEKR